MYERLFSFLSRREVDCNSMRIKHNPCAGWQGFKFYVPQCHLAQENKIPPWTMGAEGHFVVLNVKFINNSWPWMKCSFGLIVWHFNLFFSYTINAAEQHISSSESCLLQEITDICYFHYFSSKLKLVVTWNNEINWNPGHIHFCGCFGRKLKTAITEERKIKKILIMKESSCQFCKCGILL